MMMNNICMPLGNLLISMLWLSWWFYVVILVLMAICGYIFHRIRLGAIKGEKADLQSQLAERDELLRYARLDAKSAREETDFAIRNKKELLSKISHEIRTPMNAMWGMASLLNETNLSGEQREYTSTILKSGDNLIGLINDMVMKDMLQHSKIDSGKETESKEFDLAVAIEEVLEVFAAQASQTGLDLLYKTDDDVPMKITGDKPRLRQVLMNLVENAFRFTTKGEIMISVRRQGASAGNECKLAFAVKDTGNGMTPEKLSALSHELMQPEADDSDTGAPGHALVICKRLVHQMDGTITADSREKEGSVFTFTIGVGTGSSAGRAQAQKDTPDMLGKSVLIIDDNVNSGALLQHLMKQWNGKPKVVNCAKQALDILAQNNNFDLALCDLQMPGINGIDLTRKMKQLQPEMPVILLNKTGDESYRQHADLFRAVVNKPVRRQALALAVVDALRLQGAGGQKAENKLSADFSQKYPLSILIGEDDAMNQQMVTMVLKKLGYTPVIASNGKEVLEIVSHRTFDVILMDVQMPEMDGLEATRMIRLCLNTQPVIIAMTANTLQGDREECLEAGMDDYLSKPVKLPALVSILEKWALQVGSGVAEQR